MPPITVTGLTASSGCTAPREFAILHQVGVSDGAVDAEVRSEHAAPFLLLLLLLVVTLSGTVAYACAGAADSCGRVCW